MSYCRFSSDEDRSDFYVYNSGDAFTIHVVGSRFAQHPVPRYEFPEEHKVYSSNHGGFTLTPEGAEAWLKWTEEHYKTVPIDLPHAGETFYCKTEKETIAKLLELEALGYHLPPHAIERLRREIDERA